MHAREANNNLESGIKVTADKEHTPGEEAPQALAA